MTLDSCTPAQSSVLIVDDSSDCREVLSTLLQRRGVRTFEAAGARQGLDLLRRHHPDVIVLDMDSDEANDEGLCRQYGAASQEKQIAIIFLGVTPRPADDAADRYVIPKPYHYARLIRTIENLLRRYLPDGPRA